MSEHTPAPTPSRSLYGFFMYLFSKIILIVYCIWATTPDYYLHYLNIYYYPQKFWATAVPIQFLVALTIFAFFVYPSSNLMITPGIDNILTIQDTFCQTSNEILKTYNNNVCICNVDDNKCMKNNYLATSNELSENTVPQLLEYDICYISRSLYLPINKKKTI